MPIKQRRDQKKVKTETTVNENQVDWKDVEQILLEAKIVARWAKNPFYIS